LLVTELWDSAAVTALNLLAIPPLANAAIAPPDTFNVCESAAIMPSLVVSDVALA